MIDEEWVKAARSASRLIVLFSCIAIVLAFSPEEKNTYKEAVKEINVLLALDVRPLLMKGAQKNKTVRDNFFRAKSISSQYGLAFSIAGESGEIIYIEPKPIDLIHSSLEAIDNYFSHLDKLSVTLLEIDEEFEKELKDFLGKNYDSKWGKNIRLTINQDYPKPYYNLLFGNLSTGAALTHKLRKETLTIPFDMIRSLREIDKDRTLFSNIDGAYVFVPNLRQVWEQVRTETPINARAILARKDIPQEKRLAVLGLSLPERLISWTMPGLIFALSIYFLVYVLHLSRLAKINPDIRNHPWVGIMPGCLAPIVSGVMHFFLPITALLSISTTTWSGHTSTLRILLIGFAAGTVLALATANVRLLQISRSKGNGIGTEGTGGSDRGQLEEEK